MFLSIKPIQWEYCIVSTPPPGPVEVYITYYTPEGTERERHIAKNFNDGMYRLFPQIIAQLGLQGWELVAIQTDGTYNFKRPVQAVSPAADDPEDTPET